MPRQSHGSLILFLLAFVCGSSFCNAQTGQDWLEEKKSEHQNRSEKFFEEANARIEASRKRADARFEEMRSGTSRARRGLRSNAANVQETSTDELMQSSRDFMDEQRARSAEMIQQATDDAQSRMNEMRSGSSSYSSSSSSGRGVRIRGRTIKGILMLVALVVGGLWKLATSITGGGGGGGQPPKINV